MVNELPPPEQLVIGGIYCLTTGTTYVVRNDGLPMELTNILKVSTLPAIGDHTKLYLWINNGKFKLYTYDGNNYIPMDVPDIAQLLLDVEDMGYDVENIKTNIVVFAGRIEDVTSAFDAHKDKVASTTELGHVKIDNDTIKIDANGVISASVNGETNIDNNITAQKTPSQFANGHTISIVEDNGFANLFKTVTGGDTNLLNTVFKIDTYKMSDASLSYKYYQKIEVSIGDTFTQPNLVGYMHRFSSLSNSWGAATFESIVFFAEDAQFPIKYSIAGSTLNAIKANKQYISVKDTSNNTLTVRWVETNANIVKEEFDIDVLPNSYIIGVTETYLAGSTDGYLQMLSAMNTYFGWQVLNGDVVFDIRTIRNSQGEVTQAVDIYYTKVQAGKKFASMARVSNYGQTTFNDWRGNTAILYGNNAPSMAQYGMKGNLYINASTGDVYKMASTATSPSMLGWSLLVPKVVRDTYSPIEDDDETVYSAYAVEQKLNSLDMTLSGELNTHIMARGEEGSMGHVQVDGTTIVSNNGIISAVQTPVVPNIIIPGESRQTKIWTGTTVTAGGDGNWTINYASAGFTSVRTIQVTIESGITAAADKPLGTYVVSKSNTSASGKAYKATSAGLLTAMQALAAENGVTVHVMVIGH